MFHGAVRDIAAPTPASFSRQIKARKEKLQSTANDLWRAIYDERKLGDMVKRHFLSFNTQLPSLYILLKTHKFDASAIIEADDIINSCKVRPIVSCCNSLTEKLSWLVTHLLTPLLDHIPTHLKNTHQHLEKILSLTPQQLVNKSFCSADISALYTNVSIEACIDDMIQLANDNRNYLQLLGLKLIDVHRILDLVLCNAYFTYSQKLFLQVQGIFMGCKVSPLLAIARVYSFEKRVLFADAHYINIPYGRYVDDAYTLASSRRDAEMLFNRIAAQDPDSKLSWEIEFPDEDSASTFIPFLGNQIKVSGDAIMSKFYREPQKKNIVLHARSHHCLKLRDIFCNSRPRDRTSCTSITYNIYKRIEDNVDCRTTHPVYKITCSLCDQVYCGESSNSLNERLSEHWRFASNPNKPSYREEALAVHYREKDPNLLPQLKFKLLHTERNTIMRKIYEAYIINYFKPEINDKDECISVK